MNIQGILDTLLDDRTKGIPGGTEPFALKDIAGKGWRVLKEDLPLPLLVLKQSALDHNRQVFKAFLREHHVSFAPHGKTPMAPQIFKKQFEDGAWAITAATVNQIQVYRGFGVHRILMANQLVGRQNIRFMVEELNQDPEFDFFCLVDSVEQVSQLSKTAQAFGLRRPLKVLLEVGLSGGRTGCRTTEEARAVVQSVKEKRDFLQLAGVEGFEGVIAGPPKKALTRVDAYLKTLVETLEGLSEDDFEGVDEVVFSAGGTAFFDRVVHVFKEVKFSKPIRVVVRSGCYLTSDATGYAEYLKAAETRGFKGPLQEALEVWAYIQSMPEPGLALVGMGKRDCPYDNHLPIPHQAYRLDVGWMELPPCEIVAVHDQHAFLKYEGPTQLQVGDMIRSGISHPCTAFDKWRLIPVVNDHYVVVDGILTFF